MTKARFVSVGCAPSSGSTLLSNLLDSLPFAVCGPEIDLWVPRDYFTGFARIKSRSFYTSRTPSPYQKRQKFKLKRLAPYGMDQHIVRTMVNESSNFEEFSARFFDHFSRYRDKDCLLYVDKSPNNIHSAQDFLDAFQDSFFIYLVRNPLYSLKSMIRRGIPPYLAISTWLVVEATFTMIKDHERVFAVKYETLVKEPFATVADLFGKLGIDYDATRIAADFKENEYTSRSKETVSTWEFRSSDPVADGNRKKITDEDLRVLRALFNARVAQAYAKRYQLPEISFEETIHGPGYREQCAHYLKDQHQPVDPQSYFNRKSLRHVVSKFSQDLSHGDCSPFDFKTYLYPVMGC
ncbi:MAG: sulfotransferase [Desulfobulbaceae bacterium]|nr:MAG: sulfotransferase [Desulfobulbaceae bacterium]